MRTKLWRLFHAIRVLVVRAGPRVRIRLPPAASQRRTPFGTAKDRACSDFPAGDRRERVQPVARRSGQPVKPRHHQHVARVELVEQPAKLRPVGLGSARHFAEHLARPMFPQFRYVSRDALAVRRYPRIAVNHGFILHQISAPKKRNRFKGLILVQGRAAGRGSRSRAVTRGASLFRAHRVVYQHLDRQKMGDYVTAVVPVMLVWLNGPAGIFGTG
jgi:hypothetical protein